MSAAPQTSWNRLQDQVDRRRQPQPATGPSEALTDLGLSGVAQLEREIERAREATGRLAVAYISVVDTARSAVGGDENGVLDAVLLRIVHTIRGRLRSYDPVVRL